MTAEQAFEMLLQAVKSASGGTSRVRVQVGTVKEVNEKEGTCVVEREEMPELHDVRLNAVVDEKVTDRFTVFPSVGSYVLVLLMGDDTEGLIVATSTVEKVMVKTGGITMQVDKNGVVLNGGSLGGLIDIQKLTDKINSLVDAFNNHTHVVSSGGTANPITSKASTLSKSDYEDNKVKH